MSHYAQISQQIREILLSFTPLIEPLSLDEAFLDVQGCEGLFGPAPIIAKKIKTRIKNETGLTASVGVAPNKFLAKLASDLSKPDGLLVVPGDTVKAFLTPLPVSRLWGVGKKGEQRLGSLGISTIGQLAVRSKQSLVDHLGSMGAIFGGWPTAKLTARWSRTAKQSRSAPKPPSIPTSATAKFCANGISATTTLRRGDETVALCE